MGLASFLRLLFLAAIWGASFLFTRISAPVLGPAILIEARVGLAALFLLGVALLLRKPLNFMQHWKHYLVLGALNAALPFILFAFAAQTLTASAMSILNASSPIWGAIIGALMARRLPDTLTVLGLLLGVAGVSMVVGMDHMARQQGAAFAIAAALLAAFCYGLSTHYARTARVLDGFSNAHGSMWAATLLIAPALPFVSTHAAYSAGIALDVILLGLLCTGFAFLLYFRLVKEIGATSTLTVTFLIPVFGILWGCIFLGETLSSSMVVGSCVIILGTALVTKFNPAAVLMRRLSSNA